MHSLVGRLHGNNLPVLLPSSELEEENGGFSTPLWPQEFLKEEQRVVTRREPRFKRVNNSIINVDDHTVRPPKKAVFWTNAT